MTRERSLREVFDDVKSSVVKVVGIKDENRVSIGTGFLVHCDGYIVTARHVVDGCSRIEVTPENYKHSIPAELCLKNRDDMAILRIDYKGLDDNFKVRLAPSSVLPRHKHVMAGSDVGIAGYAWGMDHPDDSTLFVFKRVIALNVMHPPHTNGLFYYIDGTAIAGMSGGPVFSIESGEVLGVVVRVQPESIFNFQSDTGFVTVPSAEHLMVALQSFYIHTGLDACDITL